MMRGLWRSAAAAVVLLCVPPGCGKDPPAPSASGPPANLCPDHPCAAYGDASAACVMGVCVQKTPALSNLVLVIEIPLDAPIGGGLTYAVPLSLPVGDGGVGSCLEPGVVCLPQPAGPSGSYLVQNQTALDLHFDLGNSASMLFTSLPAHVTYRPLVLGPFQSGDAGLLTAVDAVSVGLPLPPVYADTIRSMSPGILGPSGGVAFRYWATIEPVGAQSTLFGYEQTITPDAPFDQAYPPDIRAFNPVPGSVGTPTGPLKLDLTNSGQAIPTFDVRRTDGTLDGWTAYLRDQSNRRPISPIRPLSGSAATVLLPTSHHGGLEALTNAELVLVPPAGSPLPAQVLTPPNLNPRTAYAVLPPPADVEGVVTASDGTPVESDLVFDAEGIFAAAPPLQSGSDAGPPQDAAGGAAQDSGDGGPAFQLQQTGFEFEARAAARVDPHGGASTYHVTLARGQYRVVVRPTDASYALTVVDRFDTTLRGSPSPAPIAVSRAPTLNGTAFVSDGRALQGATVEAIALHCPPATSEDAAGAAVDSPSCMPRQARAMTGALGEFSFTVDPGVYLIRAEPADGTDLPWAILPAVSVPTAGPVTLTVFPPVHLALRLKDYLPLPNPIALAVVRMFSMPARSRATEVGRALTDPSGRFEMFVAPSVP